jgi:hypothetical protein
LDAGVGETPALDRWRLAGERVVRAASRPCGVSQLPTNLGQHFVHVTDPGVHEYNIQSEATDTLRLEVEPGETYFVLEQIKMGIMVGRPTLSPSDRAMFESKPLRLSTRPGVDRERD